MCAQGTAENPIYYIQYVNMKYVWLQMNRVSQGKDELIGDFHMNYSPVHR